MAFVLLAYCTNVSIYFIFFVLYVLIFLLGKPMGMRALKYRNKIFTHNNISAMFMDVANFFVLYTFLCSQTNAITDIAYQFKENRKIQATTTM